MIILESGDRIRGDASVSAVVDFTVYGLDNRVLKHLADGQLTDTGTDLYTADSADVIISMVFANNDTDNREINLYHIPSGGQARRLVPRNFRIGAGYTAYCDGSGVSLSGPVKTEGSPTSETEGGTGLTAYTIGDVLYASAENTLAKLGIGADEEVLKVSGGVPVWGTAQDLSASEIKVLYESNQDTNAFTDEKQSKLAGIETAADVTDATNVAAAGAVMAEDTIDAQHGGTGQTSYTYGNLLYASSQSAIGKLAPGTVDQVLTMQNGQPTWVDASGGSGRINIEEVNPENQVEGDLWYDDGMLKLGEGQFTESLEGVWSTGTALPDSRKWFPACGTLNSCMVVGGYMVSGGSYKDDAVLWDGSSWSYGNGTINEAVSHGQLAGDPDGAVFSGGWRQYDGSYDSKKTSLWNGTSWSQSNNMPEECFKGGSCGSGGLAVLLGGTKSNYKKAWQWASDTNIDHYPNNQLYTWDAGPDEPYPTEWGGVVGYNRAALKFGGKGGSDIGMGEQYKEVFLTELYNGFSFTILGGMLNAMKDGGAAGTANAAIAFGGDTFVEYETDEVQLFDGVCWKLGPSMLSKENEIVGCGTQGAAMAIGRNWASEYHGSEYRKITTVSV